MFMLDLKGFLSSLFLGVLIFFYGGLNALLVMLIFLFISVAVTRFGYFEKKEIGIYEYERSWKNVVSNGIGPLIFAYYGSLTGDWRAFLGSVAAVMADKLSSELGIFDVPFDPLTLKPTKRGLDGAISGLGVFASLIGGILIAIAGWLLYGITSKDMVVIALAGVVGSLADSFAGLFERNGFGSKELSNIIGSLAGGGFVILIGG